MKKRTLQCRFDYIVEKDKKVLVVLLTNLNITDRENHSILHFGFNKASEVRARISQEFKRRHMRCRDLSRWRSTTPKLLKRKL